MEGMKAGHGKVEAKEDFSLRRDLHSGFRRLMLFFDQIVMNVFGLTGKVMHRVKVTENTAGNMVLRVFLVILNGLNSKKDATQEHSSQNEPAQELLRAPLGCGHRQRHGQAAADQHQGINKTPGDVNTAAARDKGVVILEPVNEIGSKEAAEHHDLDRKSVV